MRWGVVWGPYLDQIREKTRTGHRTPAVRSSESQRPQVPARLSWVLKAFWGLSAGRTVGGGMQPVPNPIAYSELDACARRLGLSNADEWEYFERVIRAIDSAWLEEHAKRTKRAKPDGRTKGRDRGRRTR